MKVLVTGANGQLGYDVIRNLRDKGIEVLGVDVQDMDVRIEQQVNEVIELYMPTVVVHCAAYTAVDKAEEEGDLLERINVKGTELLAKACKKIEATMVYISTDYVFDGAGNDPFEAEEPRAPLNNYGRSKADGERAVEKILNKYFIIRISWVFGINGNNFVKTMINLGKRMNTLKVVDDQIGSPTYTVDLAELISQLIRTEKYGIYHATNEGYCSWYDFAVGIFKAYAINVQVSPCSSSEFPTRAVRPKNSRLSKKTLDEAGFTRLPLWEDALDRFVLELKGGENNE